MQYISSLKELYDEFEYQDDIYYKVSQNLKQRKELLYNNGPIEKWELSENEKNIDNLIKENLDSFKYQTQGMNNNADTVNCELNVIGSNNNTNEISLKENNRNELGGQEETQVIPTKKKCC